MRKVTRHQKTKEQLTDASGLLRAIHDLTGRMHDSPEVDRAMVERIHLQVGRITGQPSCLPLREVSGGLHD